MTGTNDGSFAGNGNGDTASYFGNVTNSDVGSSAGGGTHDVAYVLDPFGAEGSSATAGFAGNSDLAGVNFVDGVTATATNGNDLVTLLPDLFGAGTSATAESFGNFLTDLMGLL